MTGETPGRCCYGIGDGDQLAQCGAGAANPGSEASLCAAHLAAADAAYRRYVDAGISALEGLTGTGE